VTHSLPLALAATGPYVSQHEEAARLVAEGVAKATGCADRRRALVYCSRSGPSAQPWLEPDVSDHLRVRRGAGARAVALLPIGFVSDHMEVIYDLDTEAARTAAEIGLAFARGATVGVAPAFVAAVRDLVLERASRERGEAVRPVTAGLLAPMPDVCAAGCCSNPRGNRSALCGRD
jgi:ferrochelatase